MNNNKYLLNILIVAAIFSVSSLPAYDAVYAEQISPEVYLMTPVSDLAPGSEFAVGVFVSSEKPVNAFDIEVSYSQGLIEFVNFNNNESIVQFWYKQPEMKDGVIHFEGGSPRAFTGQVGEIIKLNFRSLKDGTGKIFFKKTDVYYADGLGTLAQSKNSDLSVNISKDSSQLIARENDSSPPIVSDIKVIKNPADGSRLGIFSASDKESGLKDTLVRSREWLSWDEWRDVTNPFRLTAGVWAFQLKAIDNKGNVSLKTIYIASVILLKLFYFLLLLILLLAIYYFIIRRKKKLL